MKTKMISCKIGDETDKLIVKEAEEKNLSRSRVIELAIVKGLALYHGVNCALANGIRRLKIVYYDFDLLEDIF